MPCRRSHAGAAVAGNFSNEIVQNGPQSAVRRASESAGSRAFSAGSRVLPRPQNAPISGSVGHICEHMFVRWANLTIGAEEQRRLPGYREEAVVRRFDAPEALNTRFYEVRARSILNRVPEKSRMPFRWTINSYRGCSHACAYCFARPTHKYLDFNAGRDFEREIVVKVNVPE